MTTKLKWREGRCGNENAVTCCGCGSTIAVCEARIAGTKHNAVFSCSPACEAKFEATPAATRLAEQITE